MLKPNNYIISENNDDWPHKFFLQQNKVNIGSVGK